MTPLTSLSSLDVDWMVEHSKQARRMIPGGVTVIGAYAVSSSDDIFAGLGSGDAGLTKLRSLVKQLAEGNDSALEIPLDSEMLLLHLQRGSLKVNAKLLDCKSATATPKNVDFKGASKVQWQRLASSYLLDFPFPFAPSADSTGDTSLQQKVDLCLAPLEARLRQRSVCVFEDAVFRADSELVDPDAAAKEAEAEVPQKGGGGKGKKHRQQQRVEEVAEEEEDEETAIPEIPVHNVQIVLDEEDDEGAAVVNPDTGCEVTKVSARMRVVGKMAVCAFVPAGASVRHAVDCVKTDLLRSLRGRMAIHCDSLQNDEEDDEDEEEEGDDGEAKKVLRDVIGVMIELNIIRPHFQPKAVFHEPPRRMFVRLPHSAVCVCDYLFPGETPYDSVDSVLEILGFRPKIEYMDDEVEMVAAPKPQAKVRRRCFYKLASVTISLIFRRPPTAT